jgi:hypothetical protein
MVTSGKNAKLNSTMPSLKTALVIYIYTMSFYNLLRKKITMFNVQKSA